MARNLETQLDELRQTIEMYKMAADRHERAAQSCCMSLALESLERCARLIRLALATAPPEDVVREQAEARRPEFDCAALPGAD